MISRQLLTDLLNLAKSAVPIIAGPAGDQFVAAGQSILDVIDKVRPLVDGADGEHLDVTRSELDALIKRVNAHADQTIATLRDKD